VRELWWQLDTRGQFMLIDSPYWNRVLESGFVSGSSTHSDRLATIRSLHQSVGYLVDPHTADGLKVAHEQRDPAVPMICLETALPVKFADTIVEAVGRGPERPAAYADIEQRPQRCEVMPADAERVKAFIAAHAN
jgi:threonine synthase